MLSSKDVHFYRQQGYLVIEDAQAPVAAAKEKQA